MALLAADGYEVYRAPRPSSERVSTEVFNRPSRAPSAAASRPPVSARIADDTVESLKSAYLSSAGPESGPAAAVLESNPSASRPGGPAMSDTTDSDLDKLDALIENLGIGSSSGQPSAASAAHSAPPVGTAVTPRPEGRPNAPTGASILESLRSERERADQELERARRRRRVADTVGNVLRPGAVTGRIGHYLLVVVGVLLFVAFVLPPLFSAALAVISELLPIALAIVFLCWLFYRIFKG